MRANRNRVFMDFMLPGNILTRSSDYVAVTGIPIELDPSCIEA